MTDPQTPVATGRSSRRPHPLTLAGAGMLTALALAAFAGPLLHAYDHAGQDHSAILEPPSGAHWLGTARLGEDVLAQTLHGLQKSLLIGVLAALLSTFVAAVVGGLAGYLGGRVDAAAMWLTDVLLVLPAVLVVAVASPLFAGRSWLFLAVAIASLGWMLPARMIRAQARAIGTSGFVRASRLMGASTRHVLRVHLLPGMFGLLAIDCTLSVATAVLAEAGLSYVGYGVQQPDVSLGTLIATGSASAVTYPWVFLAPSAALVLTVLAVGFVGEGLRRAKEAAIR